MPAVFSLAVAIVFGLLNGWLIAYAEVPSLFTTLASGLFLAGFGQVFFFPVDVVQWSPDLHSLVLDRAWRRSRDTQASHHVRGGGGW